MRPSITILLVLTLPAAAFAAGPSAGVYKSFDIGGTMLTGHFSESFAGGGPGQIGNTIHAQSWDSVDLGTQWSLSCVSIMAAPTLVSDTRDGSGTGEVTYITHYDEGVFWLAKNGPWGDNTQNYTGTVIEFTNTSTHQYVDGALTGVVSNVDLTGVFDGFADCMDFTISNSATFGDTRMGPLPGGFPAFLDAACAATPTAGAWGSVPTITMVITGNCVVANEETTWSTVKSRW